MRLEVVGSERVVVDCRWLRVRDGRLVCEWWERMWPLFYHMKPEWQIGWCLRCGNNKAGR